MRTPTKKVALPLAIAAALAAGTGAGSAAAAVPAKSRTAAKEHAAKQRAARSLFRAVADYVDLTPKQLVAQLRGGKSLAQVATAQGKSVEGLKKIVLDAARARLDLVVASGRITAAREQQ